jgi:hypothetical protein
LVKPALGSTITVRFPDQDSQTQLWILYSYLNISIKTVYLGGGVAEISYREHLRTKCREISCCVSTRLREYFKSSEISSSPSLLSTYSDPKNCMRKMRSFSRETENEVLYTWCFFMTNDYSSDGKKKEALAGVCQVTQRQSRGH